MQYPAQRIYSIKDGVVKILLSNKEWRAITDIGGRKIRPLRKKRFFTRKKHAKGIYCYQRNRLHVQR